MWKNPIGSLEGRCHGMTCPRMLVSFLEDPFFVRKWKRWSELVLPFWGRGFPCGLQHIYIYIYIIYPGIDIRVYIYIWSIIYIYREIYIYIQAGKLHEILHLYFLEPLPHTWTKITTWLDDAVSNCKLFLTKLGTSFHGMGLWQKLVSSCQSLKSGRSSWIMVYDTIDFASKILFQKWLLNLPLPEPMIYVSLYKFHPLTSWEQEICSAIVGCWESMSLYVTSQGKAISVDDWSLPGLEKKSNSPSKMTSLARTKTGHHHHNNNNKNKQTNKNARNAFLWNVRL